MEGKAARLSAAWALAPFGLSGEDAPAVGVRMECSLSGEGDITARAYKLSLFRGHLRLH